MAQRPDHPTPQWQPIDHLPTIADAIDGMLESAEEQYPLLEQARPRPSMLDDATVGRVIEVYTAQRDKPRRNMLDRSAPYLWPKKGWNNESFVEQPFDQ